LVDFKAELQELRSRKNVAVEATQRWVECLRGMTPQLEELAARVRADWNDRDEPDKQPVLDILQLFSDDDQEFEEPRRLLTSARDAMTRESVLRCIEDIEKYESALKALRAAVAAGLKNDDVRFHEAVEASHADQQFLDHLEHGMRDLARAVSDYGPQEIERRFNSST
jgi:hypothetical protein